MVQINENLNEGLKREYTVTIASDIIKVQVDAELEKIAANSNLPGFRPGNAPIAMVKKKHGISVLGEVMEKAIQNTVLDIIKENDLKPALRPDIKIENAENYKEEDDLIFSISMEVLPEVPEINWKEIKLEKWEVKPTDEDKKKAMDEFLASNKEFVPLEKDRKAQEGDTVVIDFVGKVDGEAFEGGTANEFKIEIGSGSLIPGFEDQLVGKAVGDEFDINVTFPEDYLSEELKGKAAVFESKLLQILEPVAAEETEEFAKKLNFESLDALREDIEGRLKREYEPVSLSKVKKELFDILEEKYTFEIPEKMLSLEFDALWNQVKDPEHRSEEDKEKSDEELQAEMNKMAERRVRLGIILADLGRKEDIDVSQEELRQAVFMQAMQFKGQERQVIEFYQSNPQALEELRGPIIEDKVIEIILGSKVDVSNKEVSAEELDKATS